MTDRDDSSARDPKGGGKGPRISCSTLILLLASILALLWFFHGRLFTALGGYLVVRDEPTAADAVVVLSGGTAERTMAGAAVYRRGLAPEIILTRNRRSPAMEDLIGRGFTIPDNADIERSILIQAGIPPEAVSILPGTVDSTIDEARGTAEYASREGYEKITVVTSSYHTRRALMTFRQYLEPGGVAVRVWAAPESEFRPESWWKSRSMVRTLIIEYQKLLFYRISLAMGRL